MGKIVNIEGKEYNTESLNYTQFEDLDLNKSYDSNYYKGYKDADGNYHEYHGEVLSDLPGTTKKKLRATKGGSDTHQNDGNQAALVSNTYDMYQRNGSGIAYHGKDFMFMEGKDASKVNTNGPDANSIKYLSEDQEKNGSSYGSVGKYVRHFSIPHYHIEQNGQQKRLNALGLLGAKWKTESDFLFDSTPTSGPYTDAKLQDNAYEFEFIGDGPEVICDHFSDTSSDANYASISGSTLNIYYGDGSLKTYYDLTDGYLYYYIFGDGNEGVASFEVEPSSERTSTKVEYEYNDTLKLHFKLKFNNPGGSAITRYKINSAGEYNTLSTEEAAVLDKLISTDFVEDSCSDSTANWDRCETRSYAPGYGGAGSNSAAYAKYGITFYNPRISLKLYSAQTYTFKYIKDGTLSFGDGYKWDEGDIFGLDYYHALKGRYTTFVVNFTGPSGSGGDGFSGNFPSGGSGGTSRSDKVTIYNNSFGDHGAGMLQYFIPYGYVGVWYQSLDNYPYLILRIKLT